MDAEAFRSFGAAQNLRLRWNRCRHEISFGRGRTIRRSGANVQTVRYSPDIVDILNVRFVSVDGAEAAGRSRHIQAAAYAALGWFPPGHGGCAGRSDGRSLTHERRTGG